MRSLSFMNQLAIGVPDRPKTPAALGWLSGMRPLPEKAVMRPWAMTIDSSEPARVQTVAQIRAVRKLVDAVHDRIRGE